MKSFLTILKYASLVILLVAMTFGYLFFRVWQKNERPEIIESNWEQSEILLGHSSTLNLTVKVPWHRELNSATPVGSPDFLLPVRRLGKVEKGSLDLTGHRTWYLQIPFVATDTQSLEGQTAAFPVKSTERVSPTTINLDLPELSIVLPSDIPDDFKDPNIFLTEKPPEESEETSSNRPEKKPWWPWVVGAVVLLAVLIYILKRTGVIKTTPAWEKALGRLESLTKDSPPPVYYSKLTDILKATPPTDTPSGLVPRPRPNSSASSRTSQPFPTSISPSFPPSPAWLMRSSSPTMFQPRKIQTAPWN